MNATEITIVTGISGSGKSTYCNNQNGNVQNSYVLIYDEIFNYSNSTLSFDKIDKIMKNNNKIFLDGYNTELIQYIKDINDINPKFKCVFLYTDLDNYYDILAIKDPRNFISTGDFRYDKYILNAKNAINELLNISNELFKDISYVYRNINNNYISSTSDEHLLDTLNITKKDIALKFINDTSGHSSYQSIILDSEYIKRGSEKDWLSFENILKCTSLKDKIICDTGCFNGYFSFRSIEEGAKKVIGIDHNEYAINICNKLCIWNNYHLWEMGVKTDVSCDGGIDFHLKKIGKDNIFNFEEDIDVLFALNYLHHLKNELGLDAFLDTLDSFFKNSKEVIFEINEPEIGFIENIAKNNNFIMLNKIESHRKTSFGNRWILHYKK